jgi:hypothetical protein
MTGQKTMISVPAGAGEVAVSFNYNPPNHHYPKTRKLERQPEEKLHRRFPAGAELQIVHNHAGQLGRYQDSLYDATIISEDGWLTVDDAHELGRIFVHGFEVPPLNWASPKLASCTTAGETRAATAADLVLRTGWGLPPLTEAERASQRLVSRAWRFQVSVAYTD